MRWLFFASLAGAVLLFVLIGRARLGGEHRDNTGAGSPA
jgi:hypothetical protein